MKSDNNTSKFPPKREIVLFGVFFIVLFGASTYMHNWVWALTRIVGILLSSAFGLLIFALLYKGWTWAKKPTPPFLP